MVVANSGEMYFEKADLWMEITYDIDKDSAKINTNLKAEKARDFIQEYLRTQLGAGKGKGVEEYDQAKKYTSKLLDK